jgi:hypothetical protein
MSRLNCSPLPSPNQQFYRDEHLFVDLRDQVVMLDSETIPLTRQEYRLLALWWILPDRLSRGRLS